MLYLHFLPSPPLLLFPLLKTKAADLPSVDQPHAFSNRFRVLVQFIHGKTGVFLLPPSWSFWFIVLSHLALIYSGKIIRISLLWRVEWKCKQCFPAGGCFITLTGAFEFAWVADRLGYLCVSRTWKPWLWLGLWLGLKLGKRLELCGVGNRDLGENWGCLLVLDLVHGIGVWLVVACRKGHVGIGMRSLCCGRKQIHSCIEEKDGLGWYLHVIINLDFELRKE